MYHLKFTFMNNRLQQFLELENLTSARLAEILGVQRSGLSHILSGRNKPGYEFLTKLLNKFPHVNSDWLLLGKGKPYKETTPNFQGTPLPPGQNFPGGSSNFSGSSQNFSGGNSIGSVPYNNGMYNGIQYNGMPYSGIQYADSPILDHVERDFLEVQNSATDENSQYSVENKDINPQNNTSQPLENCMNGQNKGNASRKREVKRVIIFYNDGSFDELFPHIR